MRLAIRTRFAVALAASLLAGAAAAHAGIEETLRPERTVLENGLTVVTVTNPGAAVASVQVWYHGGSRLDPPGRAGLTHLFEHLLSVPQPAAGGRTHAAAVADLGGGSGAYTTWDAQVFVNTVPAAALEPCVQLEAQRMRTPALSEETLARQRAAIRPERAAQRAAQPLAVGLDALIALVFAGHPYANPLFGHDAQLDSVTVAEAEAFRKARVAPDRVTVVIASPRQHAEAVTVVRRHFGSLPRSGAAAAAPAALAEQAAARRNTAEAPTGVPVLLVGFRAAPAASADQRALEVAQQILSEGSGSRLWRRLVEQDRLAILASGSSQERLEPGLVSLFAYVRPGASESDLEAALFAEVARLGEAGPSPEELAAAHDILESKLLYRMLTAEGRAQAVAQASVLAADPAAAARRPAAWRAVTADDVRRVVSAYMTPPKRNVVWLRPPRGGSAR